MALCGAWRLSLLWSRATRGWVWWAASKGKLDWDNFFCKVVTICCLLIDYLPINSLMPACSSVTPFIGEETKACRHEATCQTTAVGEARFHLSSVWSKTYVLQLCSLPTLHFRTFWSGVHYRMFISPKWNVELKIYFSVIFNLSTILHCLSYCFPLCAKNRI